MYRRLRAMIPREWEDVEIGFYVPSAELCGMEVIGRHWWITLTYKGERYRHGLGMAAVHHLRPTVDAWHDIRCDGMAEAAGWFISMKLCERSISDAFFTVRCLDPVVEAKRQAKEAEREKKAKETRERIDRERAALETRVRNNSHALLRGLPFKLSEQAVFARDALRGCLMPKLA
jgi:hypothetical protein